MGNAWRRLEWPSKQSKSRFFDSCHVGFIRTYDINRIRDVVQPLAELKRQCPCCIDKFFTYPREPSETSSLRDIIAIHHIIHSFIHSTPTEPTGTQRKPREPSETPKNPREPSGNQRYQGNPADPKGTQRSPAEPSGTQRGPAEPKVTQRTQKNPAEPIHFAEHRGRLPQA